MNLWDLNVLREIKVHKVLLEVIESVGFKYPARPVSLSGLAEVIESVGFKFSVAPIAVSAPTRSN